MQPLPDGDIIALKAAKNLLAALPICIAVVRQDNQALAAMLRQSGMMLVECPAHKTDMADSLVTAIENAAGMPAAQNGYVIALADMPFIQPATISSVAKAIEHGAQIAMPSYQGQRGHPVSFAAAFQPQLVKLSGDSGARDIIKSNADKLTLVETDDAGIIADIDTQEDLRAATGLMRAVKV